MKKFIAVLGVLSVVMLGTVTTSAEVVTNDEFGVISTFGVVLTEQEVVSQEDLLVESCPRNVSSASKSYNITYMAYQAVTATGSSQYRLLYGENAYTDESTGIRMVDGRYCVAVGTGWASVIGTKIDVVMDNGSVFKCILGDVKADIHTDPTNKYQAMDGSVLEMIVDRNYALHYPDGLSGTIAKIVVIGD